MERDTSGQGRHLGGMSSKWLGPKIVYNYHLPPNGRFDGENDDKQLKHREN
jgi:hypothetical protein